MGRSCKSRSKKTDKETQSPMLKIFKDIMQREKNDPEKLNLLKEPHDDKKKKQYSESKSKSDHAIIDSSSTERCKRSTPFRAHEQRDLEYEQDKKQSTPLQSEKRESWWLWGDNEKVEPEETCSCVSCALKKLAGSEFMCIGCLLTVFTLSVVVAFMLVFRGVPSSVTTYSEDLRSSGINTDSERMKRKIDLVKEGRGFNFDLPMTDNKLWGDSITRPLDGLSAISPDFSVPSFRDVNNLGLRGSPELSSALGGNNVFDLQNSNRLREFYRKLIQTDAQINMLKKGVTDFTLLKTDEEKLKNILERTKRSLNLHKRANIKITRNGIAKQKRDSSEHFSELEENKTEGNNVVKDAIESLEIGMNKNENAAKTTKALENFKINANNEELDNSYPKDRDDGSSEGGSKIEDATNGVVIENNKLIVKYKPDERKKVPKCSHAPKEGKSHENQLKHPFYKNTQRLDELLDRLMEKGLPGILVNSLSTDVVYQNKCKHLKVDGVKGMDKEKTKSLTSRVMNKNDIYEFPTEPSDKITGTDGYNVVLSISTILNPQFLDISPGKHLGRGFNHRKLMQADEVDEENLGYEDLKEVLTDDFEGHDDSEIRGERTKRNEDTKDRSSGIYNQNWKGPMTLYPDEINSMINHATLSANNPRALKRYEAEARLNTKADSPEEAKPKSDVGDVQYIEDYLINKYDKLAQAYSDYGVLNEKKETIKTKKDEETQAADHRVKLSIDKSLFKGNFFDRLKKGTQSSEGIRFEVRPSENSLTHREDNPSQVYKYLQKHVKISHDNTNSSPLQDLAKWPLNEDLEVMHTPNKYETSSSEKSEKKYENEDADNDSTFPINKGKRSLKSIETDSDLYENAQMETDISDYKDHKNTNINISQDILDFDHHILKRQIKDDGFYFKNKTVNHNETNLNFNHNTTADKENIDDRFIKNYSSQENLHSNNTGKANDGQSLSDFFMMLANFFSFLDGVDTNDSNVNSSVAMRNSSMANNKTMQPRTEIFYPMYDSEMIENIGHRSRVILSVEEKNFTVAKFDNTAKDDLKGDAEIDINTIQPTGTSEANNVTVDIPEITPLNATKPIEVVVPKTNNNTEYIENKNIVKRHADDTNLIFWNDMYDDEYGVNADHLENNVRDKHSAKPNDIVKPSHVWLKDKVRKLTDNIRWKTVKEGGVEKHRTSENVLKSGSKTIPSKITKKINRRDLKVMGEDIDGGTLDFAALTENMKEVCRKAAKAVQHTRNLEVREGSKESAVASSLMQQLVRLMTDLVDFQVQQKTCLKLPPDLQNFLEWLTGNEKTEDMKRGFDDVDSMLAMDSMANYDKSTENYLDLLTPVTEKELQTLSKSDCLDTLHAIQDLMQQYEAMGEEDKSKMTGIKGYLENQLDYLQKRLNTIDDYNSYQATEVPLKYRRSLFKNTFSINDNPRTRRSLRKFVKDFGKKHTKTTANMNEYSRLTNVHSNLKLRSKSITASSIRKHKAKVHHDDANIEENSVHKRIFNDRKRVLKDVEHRVNDNTKK